MCLEAGKVLIIQEREEQGLMGRELLKVLETLYCGVLSPPSRGDSSAGCHTTGVGARRPLGGRSWRSPRQAPPGSKFTDEPVCSATTQPCPASRGHRQWSASCGHTPGWSRSPGFCFGSLR